MTTSTQCRCRDQTIRMVKFLLGVSDGALHSNGSIELQQLYFCHDTSFIALSWEMMMIERRI